MDPLKIDRINELYRKSKTSGLTVEELREQEALRKEYAALFRNNLKQQLENLTVIDEDGREYKLKKEIGSRFVMKNMVIDRIVQNPIIAAVREEKDLDAALSSQVTTVFLLHANIFNISGLVDRIKSRGKSALIHIDFLEGLGRDQKALDYIVEIIKPDGIITTRSNFIKLARDKGMFTIQRFFLVDSQSFETAIKTAGTVCPDMIEVMPAIMPSILKKITSRLTLPVIAGGLIESKQDIIEIIKSGAIGASTGKIELWSS